MTAHVLQNGPWEGKPVDALLPMVDIEAAKAWAEAALTAAEKEENEGLRNQHAQDVEHLNAERYRRWHNLINPKNPEPAKASSAAPGAGSPPPAPRGVSPVSNIVRSLEPMLALTIWQPYAWCIAEGWKLVENRGWEPNPKQLKVGQRFAIHAGSKEPDDDDVAGIREMLYDSRGPANGARPWHILPTSKLVRGCVVAVATLAAIIRTEPVPGSSLETRIVGDLPKDQEPFYFGPFGWLLKDVVKLEQPVRARGLQTLWQLPGDVLFAVHEQLRGAK